MKIQNFILSILLFILSFTNLPGQTDNSILKQTNEEEILTGSMSFNWTDGDWQLADSSIYTFNEENLLSSELRLLNSNNEWRNNLVFNYLYNENQKVVNEIQQEWVNNNWLNKNRKLYEYDSNTKIQTYELWNDSVWKLSGKGISLYNEFNNIVNRITFSWEDSIWLNISKYDYSYNEENLISSYLFYYWEDEQWSQKSKSTYTYEDDGNKIIRIDQNWNNSSWETRHKSTRIYEGDTVIYYTSEYWINGEWVDNWILKENFVNGNIRREYMKTWEETEWVNFYYKVYYYESISGVQNTIGNEELLSVYPNPTKGMMNIRFHNKNTQILNIEIYTLSGELVCSNNFKNFISNYTLDLSTLSSGNYILKLLTEDNIFIKNIIISN